MLTGGERSTGKYCDWAVVYAGDGDQHKAREDHEPKQSNQRIAQNAQDPHKDVAIGF